MGKTAINWVARPGTVARTWNVTRGCTAVSEGCAHCWARAYHHRFEEYRGWGPFSEVTLLPEKLEEPLHWRDPATVFVCSRSDLFHIDIPADFTEEVIRVAKDCPQHTFLFLTKRPEVMAGFEFPPNAWAGVTAENQEHADERLSHLANVSAPVHFVSCEPLLGPITHWPYMPDWVIVGCESGPGARPMDEDWVRSIRADCIVTQTPFFYKQAIVNGKMDHRPLLDGERWTQWPA